jgi:hypothetical protein
MRKAVLELSCIMIVTFSLFGAQPAHAYLDPGMGSLLLQGALASFAALTATTTYYWKSLKQLISKTRRASRTAGERQNGAE